MNGALRHTSPRRARPARGGCRRARANPRPVAGWCVRPCGHVLCIGLRSSPVMS